MKNYMIKYILADDEQQKETEFSIQCESLDKAVDALVAELGKNYNPANVDLAFMMLRYPWQSTTTEILYLAGNHLR